MDDVTLKKLQNTELEILKKLDEYCRDHDIKYSLIAGSLLGAVRHGGFIPWDDDIDVAMTRAEYTKFCECIAKDPIPKHVFSNYENDKTSGICHGKLGKEGTVFIQKGDVETRGHHEIWVDIFPFDKTVIGEKNSETIKIGKELVMLTRANDFRTDDSATKKIVKAITRLYPNRHKRMIRDAQRLVDLDMEISQNYEWISMSCFESISKWRYPRELLDDYVEIEFEGYPFLAFSGYEAVLRILYGDYMQLPPESERVCKHNPLRIEF